MSRPSPDALAFAAEWLDSYEPGPGDANGAHATAVATWLRGILAARGRDAAIRAELRSRGLRPTSHNVSCVRHALGANLR